MSDDTDVNPTSPLETMHEAVFQAQAVYLRDLTNRIRACCETLELCVDELQDSRVHSSCAFKAWRAADKHLSQLIAELETQYADLRGSQYADLRGPG
jgi:hypothetical protein